MKKGELFGYIIPDKICSKNPNPVLGNVASGSYTAGDEYICKVNEDISYNFMIVNSNEEYVYLMVMNDQNDVYTTFGQSPLVSKDDFIKAGGTEVLWNSTADTYPDQVGKYTYGPITALEKLDEITKDWYYISKLNEYYTDKEGNYTIYLSGRARLYSFSDTMPTSYDDYSDPEISKNLNFWVMDTLGGQYIDMAYGSIWTYLGWEYGAMFYDASSLQKIAPVIKVPKSKIA